MRVMPPRERRARPLRGQQRFAWVATWLQDRRRRRRASEPASEPVTLLTDLVGYWDGDAATANAGAVADFDFAGAVTWGYDVGPGVGACTQIDTLYDSATLENWDVQFQEITAGPTTWNLWVKLQGDSGLADIFGLFNVGAHGYFPSVTVGADCVLVWKNSDGSGHQTSPPVALPSPVPVYDEFFMVTVVQEPTRMRLFINSVLTIDEVIGGFSPMPAEPFRINGRYWMWLGVWANFGFWTRALEAGEVSALYNGGTGLTAGELT